MTWHTGTQDEHQALDNVAEIRLLGYTGDRGVEFRLEDGPTLTYSEHANGMRWGPPWTSRDRIDELLGVPGGARMLEDLWRLSWRSLDKQMRVLDERRREIGRDHEYMMQQVTDARRRLEEARMSEAHLSHGRHLALRRWRGGEPRPSERPVALRHVRGIKRLHPDQPCHVYFLVNKGEVVYVGQTSVPWPSRITNHLADPEKEFDEVWYLPVDADSLSKVEAHYIAELQPRHNKAGLR